MNHTRRPLSWSLILIVGFLTLCPVLMLLLGSFSQGLTAFGSFTTAKYVAAYTDPFLLEVTFNTVVFVLGSSLFSTALAVFLAYLNTRTNMPMKGVFTVLSIGPMMIPHLLFSVSWALLLNPSNGLINMFLQDTLGLQEAPLNIYSLLGMILVEGLLNMPVAYLIIAPAMASFDVSMEESSRVFGGGLWRTLMRVTLPILRPAIMAAFILAIVRALASYAVPRVLGTPGRVDVLATYLFERISTGFAPDYGKAAALGMSVLSASIALIVLYRYMTKESSKYVTISSRGFKPTQLELRRAKIPLFIIVGIISLLMVVLPVAVLLYTSMIPVVGQSRRLRRSGRAVQRVWACGDLVVDDATQSVTRAGEPVALTATEFKLLRVLIRNAERIVPKEQLLTEVWANEADNHLLEVHMSSLRRKLEVHGPRMIRTIRATGYLLHP